MAVLDLQTFLQERARAFDENLDLTSGSPFDTQVIQPTLRRLGKDPFSVDLAVFLNDRLNQAFPELATDQGDSITDLLIKPATLLWDPIVREIFRIRNGLSFRDPTILTTDEAEALGANLFSEREKGNFSRGSARIYFPAPRAVTASPANFFTTRGGLHFFPDGVQSITLEEMLLNVEGSLYYFDVNVIAESAGTQYNISAGEIVTVANIESTVRVTNLRRFRSGVREETASEFVGRAQQELTERSMVTLRGIGARVTRAFPEVSRLGVVGYNDPEMQRDIITGGGLGELIAFGSQAQGEFDEENKTLSRRVRVLDAGIDFTSLIGPSTVAPEGFVLTLHGGFLTTPSVRDLNVLRVISADTIELEEQVVSPIFTGVTWTLRKRELTLSGIPGGILFPDNANGTVTIPNNQVHIGGMYDIYLRSADVEEATLVIDNVSDDEPIADGSDLSISSPGVVSLGDFVLGTDYNFDDELYNAFADAKTYGFTLQILEGVHAGSYRVVDVSQVTSAAPLLTLDTAITVVAGSFRWRLVDTIEVDLLEPKETRVAGDDLITVQNTDIVQTASSTDFNDIGVSADDILRIEEGPDEGDYTVVSLPAFNQIELDRPLTASNSNLSYTIFRSNSDGGMQLPMVRVTSIELLDSSGQPVGSKIPYAKPIDIQSRAFQNPGRGVKIAVRDAELGIVTQPDPGGGFPLTGKTLELRWINPQGLAPTVLVTFAGTLNATQVAAAINAQAAITIGPGTRLATVIGGDRVGIIPIGDLVYIDETTGGSARNDLFGDLQFRSTADIRSQQANDLDGWSAVSPAINEDNLDVAMVLDGNQIGFYGRLHTSVPGQPLYDGLISGDVFTNTNFARFAPEVGRHVQVGARSIGSARVYFLEPTSIEFSEESLFSVTLADGATVRFFPDPTVETVRIPAPPSEELPKDGSSTTGTAVFAGLDQDFVQESIRIGDVLDILYVYVTGSVALADPVVNLALTTLIVSVDGGSDQTITFANDIVANPTDVTRDGVVDQINNAVGREIVELDGSNQLRFIPDVSIIIRGTGTANALLGLPLTDKPNDSLHKGRYVIESVLTSTLVVNNNFPAGGTVNGQSYKISRPGTQRVSSTQMNENVAEAGLYYFDVELVSEGTGDLWNISSALQLAVEVFRSDGYWLSTEDENLSFSMVERPQLHISRSILEVGVSDSPRNATQITGQNIEVSYEYSTAVADVQNFASSDIERVVNANPLARHLVPHFVRFDFEYAGGSRTDVVTTDIENYINGLFPQDLLESSDLQDIAYRRGATSVQNPISLIAVVHRTDRSIQAQRSQNSLNTGRLAAFIPDVLSINRRST